jgi:hypothetical protein
MPQASRKGHFRVALLCGILAMAFGPHAWASPAPRPVKAQGKSTKKSTGRISLRAAAKARAEARAKTEAAAIAAGKAAVFVFEGDETEPLRSQVVHLLRANGMRVRTDLRPIDTAEQFRDMAAVLKLAIYVHGRIQDMPGGRSSVTVTIRSGVTGRKIAVADFEGERRELVSQVGQGLWDRVRSPLARACVAALKPGRRHNAPMRIEAGTPIADVPRTSDGT